MSGPEYTPASYEGFVHQLEQLKAAMVVGIDTADQQVVDAVMEAFRSSINDSAGDLLLQMYTCISEGDRDGALDKLRRISVGYGFLLDLRFKPDALEPRAEG